MGTFVNQAQPEADSSLSDAKAAGAWMHQLIRELFPICRSITGDGVRATLAILGQQIPLSVHEVPTGTQVFDWTIPQEWNIRDAFIKNSTGDRVVDFQRSNLHVLQYSEPINRRMSRDDLVKHLFTIPEHPDWIPYRTSYYQRAWGFCVSQNQLATMTDAEYEVCIDSSLVDGALTYGECHLPGEIPDEVLISCHVCHPSLCNDNLSGVALATALARSLRSRPHRHSYRFLFIPGTIGSIAWLYLNRAHVSRIKHGIVVSCVGDAGTITYKRSRRGDAVIDRAVAHVLKHSAAAHSIVDFSPFGYDERQYCSPGFDLPVGCLMRTPHGQFPQYHTSADNPDFVHPEHLGDSFATCLAVLDLLETNRMYVNMNPHCEPQLGKRGLYAAIGGRAEPAQFQLALLWVLNLSDGAHSLLDIAERSNLSFAVIRDAARSLEHSSLLQQVALSSQPSTPASTGA